MSAERNCPRKKLLNRYVKRFEKRKKDPKNDPKRDRIVLAPLRPLKNISPALSMNFNKSFSPPKFAQIKKKIFFHREALQGQPR